LISKVVSAPVLRTFDPDLPITIFTDSFGFAIGGWLGQPDSNDVIAPAEGGGEVLENKALNKLRPVVFWSRKMTPAECRYPVHEQELLALVEMIKHNRPYLLGRQFRALTDHKSLTWLNILPHLSCRQARWVELIQELDMEIEYIPGKWNSVADILSRRPDLSLRCIKCRQSIIEQN
jgi:hypothetical protein